MNDLLIYILIGLVAGIISGLTGLGGGLIVIPCLVLLFGLSQHQAQGTTIVMMLPPIGILAAWTYYKQGHVDIQMAIFMALGFLLGGLLGANLANEVSNLVLQKVFGLTILVIAIRMIFL